MSLSKLGKETLPFDGDLLVPPGTKSSITWLHHGDGVPTGQMILLNVHDGVEVMLMVRNGTSEKDPAILKGLLAVQGPLVIDRRDPAGYMLVIEREDGYVVQGAMWPVEPGLDCATQNALTVDELAETLAICDSFAK